MMNLNPKLTPLLLEALEDLSKQGLFNLVPTLEKLMNELMLIEREQAVGAASYERSEQRKDYCNGFKDKMLNTRSGILNLKVPQTRNSDFYPTCLEKGDRTEKALKSAIAEMYVQGVSTRRIKKVTEELCSLEVSSSQVSRMNKILDEELKPFKSRPLGKMRYIYLDADYQKVRHNGQVISMACLKAIGVNEEGYREVLGISCSLSEAEVHWRAFLEDLLSRGLHGIELIISDSHSGLKKALTAVFPSVPWQRCIFHLAQNAQHYVPNVSLRKEIAQITREIYQSLSLEEAEGRMKLIVKEYEKKAPDYCSWLEENFKEGLTFFRYPKSHWKKIRTSNVVERLNQEVKRRTRVARLFPNVASCERLVASIALNIHEEWLSGNKYIVE
jgi:putative transposase